MNIKLAQVVSDVTGVTGLAIIHAILEGKRDPSQLAKLRNGKCKRSQAEIARALQGNWRAEHLFALHQAAKLYTEYRCLLAECDEQLRKYLVTLDDRSGGRPKLLRQRRHNKGVNEPAFDLSQVFVPGVRGRSHHR